MKLTNNEMLTLIQDLKDNVYKIPHKKIYNIILADHFDIRYIGKNESKKLNLQELDSLIEYGDSYIKEYHTGKFMRSKSRSGYEVADFDETEAYREISNSVEILKLESKRRM
jgi:hypothetical protein